MRDVKATPTRLTFHPLTPDRWGDLETLFGSRGAYAGCWCMWWRLKRSEFQKQQGEGNRRVFKAIVDSGEVPGILAYDGDTPIGWCSVAPRDTYPSVMRSRVLKPVDDQPVWSIVCFFVDKNHRSNNVIEALISAAVEYVKEQGGSIVEAYPTDPRGKRLQAISTYMGFPAVFERAGFVVVSRPSEARVIMRYEIE